MWQEMEGEGLMSERNNSRSNKAFDFVLVLKENKCEKSCSVERG